MLAGISPEDIARGLGGFCGACRRMEYKGDVNGGAVYEDYGHHPTEISATLRGAKAMAEGRLICVYQPHTYSRTAALLDGFVKAFDVCDKVIFVDIYAAREKNVYGISSRTLADRIGERATYAESFEAAARAVTEEISAGDVAIVMGAGDVWKVFDHLEYDKEV
jgi:UDP-N-acetylmuramate--alanine ligase